MSHSQAEQNNIIARMRATLGNRAPQSDQEVLAMYFQARELALLFMEDYLIKQLGPSFRTRLDHIGQMGVEPPKSGKKGPESKI